MTLSPTDPVCEHCGLRRGAEVACRSCSALTLFDGQGVRLASRWRRLGGSFLESLLFLLTLGVGWLIWFHFTAKTAQTPSKRLLAMYIISQKQAAPSTHGRVWLRELGIEWLLFGVVLSWMSGGIVPLADALWILFDRQKQTLHDKIAGTLVVHAPAGLRSVEAQTSAIDSRPMPSAGGAPSGSSAGSGPGPAPGGPESYGSSGVRGRLQELRRLWESGEISADEYEERRRRILDEL
ncbi:MAG: putative membrane protein YckC, RDD family [Chloroflexi bacterium]|nr:MAG: putative membrane protein YckC, RDD family [Chloroflexota bacterium]